VSGFFGLIRHDGNRVEEGFLEGVAEQLTFRGPDGKSVAMKNVLPRAVLERPKTPLRRDLLEVCAERRAAIRKLCEIIMADAAQILAQS
jgi:hypothetical protein